MLLSSLVRNGEAEEGLTEIEDFPDVSLPCSVLLAHIQNPHETFGNFLIALLEMLTVIKTKCLYVIMNNLMCLKSI